MQFKFIGREPSDFMGFQWYPGTVHDVTDAHAVSKLSNSVLFEALDAPAETDEKPAFSDYVPEPKRRGRPPNAAKVIDGNAD